MGLKDNYAKLAGQPTPASPPPVSAPVAASAAPAPAPVQTTVAPPAAGGMRDLAAMRAKLAQRQTGGVNPPEAAAAVQPALFEPKTQETADGGAEPIPSPDATPSAPETAPPAPAPELTRGQKAAATRAAKKAAAGAGAAAPVEASATPSIDHQAVALERIAIALEKLVAWTERNP